MNQEDKKEDTTKRLISGTQMSRQDIIDAVTDPNTVVLENKASKNIVIPNSSSIKADTDKLARDMDVPPGTLMHIVLRVFCEEKNASATNAKVLVMRIRNLSDEQLKVVRVLCIKKDFTATSILKAIQSIKRFDGSALLALRAFIDLHGIGPGPLNQYFNTTLPQSKPTEVGREAYENEVREKMMRPDQTNAFYTICNQVKGLTTSDAISVLRSVRQLKPQHAIMMSTLLKPNAVIGESAVTNANITPLVKRWLRLPEMKNDSGFRRLTKRLSRKTKKQPDFLFIIQSYREAILLERSGGRIGAILRRIFG
ncbi:MAG: hypothetical protein MI802_13745 [Desulfobacterales bacterium]|nr:hypothetical protein [Desulfobacterales bacterium]